MICCNIQIEKIENGFIVSADHSACYPPRREFYASREELETNSLGLIKLALDRAAKYEQEQQKYQNTALGVPASNSL